MIAQTGVCVSQNQAENEGCAHVRARLTLTSAHLLICRLKVRFLPGSPLFLSKTWQFCLGHPVGQEG